MYLPTHSGMEDPHASEPEPTPPNEDGVMEARSTQAAQQRSRGMTTGQMVVLWYAVVVIEVMLWSAAAALYSDAARDLVYGSMVVIFAAALIYSLGPHPAANKRRLARAVLVPLCTVAVTMGALVAILAWLDSRAQKGHESSRPDKGPGDGTSSRQHLTEKQLWDTLEDRGAATTPSPWDNIEWTYPVGCVARGTIIKIVPDGAFMQLQRGLTAFIPLSEMSWTGVRRPSEVVRVGADVEAMVLDLRKDEKTIIMGIKQTQTHPRYIKRY